MEKTGLSIYASASNQVAYDPDKDGFSNMPKAKTWSINPKFYYYINADSEFNFGFNTTIDRRTGGDMEVIKGNEDDEHIFSESNSSQRYATNLLYRNSNENRTILAKNSVSYFNRELNIPDYNYKGKQLSQFFRGIIQSA